MSSLLTLPNELLWQIASEVAPLGGKKASNLRLVCQRLADITSPMVLGSLEVPAVLTLGNAQVAALLLPPLSGVGAHTTSVKINLGFFGSEIHTLFLQSLPSIQQLHLVGAHVPVPDVLFDLIPALNLTTLILEAVDLSYHQDFATWGAGIKTLSLRECGQAWIVFGRDGAPGSDHFEHQENGLSKIETAAYAIMRLLNWMGDAIENLELSVTAGFEVAESLSALSLRQLTSLTLSTGKVELTDIFTISAYNHLVRLINPTSFPSLTSLFLRGWLDLTDISNLAQRSILDLAVHHQALYLLLGFLRSTKIRVLRLENSEGHAQNVRCIFERVEDGEWETRVNKLW
ncbi:hypothetical protein RQP46_010467 [Phenoliferia psychrophenolica]